VNAKRSIRGAVDILRLGHEGDPRSSRETCRFDIVWQIVPGLKLSRLPVEMQRLVV
jgi:hypothetical protein